MEMKKSKNNQERSEDEQRSRMYTIRCLNPNYNINNMVFTQWYTNRKTINTHLYHHLIYHKSETIVQWGNNILFNKLC